MISNRNNHIFLNIINYCSYDKKSYLDKKTILDSFYSNVHKLYKKCNFKIKAAYKI